MRSGEEMAELLGDHFSAIAATLEIAERWNLELELGSYHLPEFQVPAGETREAVLGARPGRACGSARARRRTSPSDGVLPSTPETHGAWAPRDRLDGFAGQLPDRGGNFIGYARRCGIPCGPGAALRRQPRGSQLGMTGIDPIEYDIIFERFLNTKHISLPTSTSTSVSAGETK